MTPTPHHMAMLHHDDLIKSNHLMQVVRNKNYC